MLHSRSTLEGIIRLSRLVEKIRFEDGRQGADDSS